MIACHSIELTRLPWEVWKIGAEFGTKDRIKISRIPANIQTESAQVYPKRSRARILAIIGQDNTLNFQHDLETLAVQLKSLVTLETVSWKPGKSTSDLEAEIKQAITDKKGWDILFFAGHSNETKMTGGELGIAPNRYLQIKDIAEQLKIAKNRGLKFALFNSCTGLSIAEALIDLGLNQVAVMREPIHNAVAQEFLLEFLKNLAQYKNVQDCLVETCQFLKSEKSLTYPSAYLIPSLFRYPNTECFRLKPSGWKNFCKQLFRPKLYEVTVLATLSVLSLLPFVQYQLLEQRIKVQSDYRRLTQQFPNHDPSILLVYIKSEEGLNRQYLAQLVDQTAKLNPQTVGFDYLLYEEKPHEDTELEGSLERARSTSETLYIFATSRKKGQRHWTLPKFVDQKWQGDTRIWRNGRYMTLLPLENEDRPFPLSYLLALAHRTRESGLTSLQKIHPNNLTEKLFTEWMQPSLLTQVSYSLNQYWLHPIIDFSIPPEYIYRDISAQEFLQTDSLWYPVIMIVPGGYKNAGISRKGEDNLPPPLKFCNPGIGIDSEMRNFCRTFVGGEVHAYLFHHFLKQKPVTPIPDLWLLWLFALVTKGIVIVIEKYHLDKPEFFIFVVGGTVVYGLVSFQLYISSYILLPILIPSSIFWIYILPHLNSRKI